MELKSTLARSQTSQTYTAAPKQEPVNPVIHFDAVNIINEQKLNLFPAKCNESEEEFDED